MQEQINELTDINLIKGYVAPTDVFVLNNEKCDNYNIELVLGCDIGYIIKGIKNSFEVNTPTKYKCYYDFDAFISIYELGKKLTEVLYEDLIKQNKDKYVLANIVLGNTSFVLELSRNNVENIKPIILDWLKTNGMPFTTERENFEELDNAIFAQLITFVDKCITIYIIYTYIDINKKNDYYGNLTDEEQNTLSMLSNLLLNKKTNNPITIDETLKIIAYTEKNNNSINMLYEEKLIGLIDRDNIIKYRNIRFYTNILSVAWHKMKLMIAQDINNSSFRSCRICQTPYKITSNNQKYCEYCKLKIKQRGYNDRYYKMLELHQQLKQAYNKLKIKDDEIEKITNLKLKKDIKNVGVQRLEELLKKCSKLHSL